MKKIRKLLLCIMIALTAAFIAPHGMTSVEVQAAAVETPRLINASSGSKTSFIRWDKVKGASGYRVYRKVDGKRWRLLETVSGSSNTIYEDKNMKPGTCYVYTVRAYKKVNGETVLSSYNKKVSVR